MKKRSFRKIVEIDGAFREEVENFAKIVILFGFMLIFLISGANGVITFGQVSKILFRMVLVWGILTVISYFCNRNTYWEEI